MSDREKRRKREENKGKENKPEIKQEKKKRMFNLNDAEAETDLIRRNIFEPRISTIVDDTSEDEETAFMESSSTGKEVYDGEEETGFMGSEEEETSFMGVSNKKNSDSTFLIADENALDSHAERFCGDALVFADEEETAFMNDSSAFVDNNEEETGFMGTCSVSRNSAYSKDSDSDFADEDETGFMSSAMNLSQVSEKKKKNARNMETGSAEIPVSENIRSFIEEEDEEETEFMRKNPVLQRNEKKVIENTADVSRIEDDEETSFMGISID